jgi:hypothetical protein
MRRTGILALSVFCLMAAPAAATTLEQVGPVDGYSSPVFVTSDPGDPDRIFVVERGGTIQLTEDGSTVPFLDLDDIVQSDHGEEGLLSMAFAPDYATTGHLYVYFTNNDGDIEVDEFTADSIPVDIDTRREVITIPHPDRGNHNGGQLQFGPDGYLYLAPGDGGGGGDPDTNAQDLGSLLGKMLRIDPAESGTSPYTVPADNPFVGQAGVRPEIWSYGLRNPFRFSFDRLTEALLIGDVGQGEREEVDYEPEIAGGGRADNFGWSCREGLIAYSDMTPDPACSGATGFTNPIHDYEHGEENCSITGGYVARDASLGDLYGRYLYADFCAGELRSLIPGLPRASCDRSMGLSIENPSSFGEDSSGRVYVVSLTGPVYRLVGDTQIDCPRTPDAPGAGPAPDAAPEPSADTALDDESPLLRVRAPRRQQLERGGRLVCKVQVDEPSDLVARLALVADEGASSRGRTRAAVLRRFQPKAKELRDGVVKKVRWRVRRADVRAVRRASRNGESLAARFRVRARDAAGDRELVELRSRLG